MSSHAVQRVDEQTVSLRQHRPIRHRATDSEVVGITGLAVMTIGVIAVTRAGVDGPMNQPVVEVLGFTHTATLAAIEVGIGLCLIVGAATTSRAATILFGSVLGIGAFVAVQTDSLRRSLALQLPLAWIAVVIGALVVLISLLMPRTVSNTTLLERPES